MDGKRGKIVITGDAIEIKLPSIGSSWWLPIRGLQPRGNGMSMRLDPPRALKVM
jgi:hypothetical protein